MLPTRGSGCKDTNFSPYLTQYIAVYTSLLRFFKNSSRENEFQDAGIELNYFMVRKNLLFIFFSIA
jgi:hypothetical protein